MISVTGLTKTFRRLTAVDDLSFEVRRGEAVVAPMTKAAPAKMARFNIRIPPCKPKLHYVNLVTTGTQNMPV